MSEEKEKGSFMDGQLTLRVYQGKGEGKGKVGKELISCVTTKSLLR